MSIKLDQCNPKLRERILAQLRAESKMLGIPKNRIQLSEDYLKAMSATLRQEKKPLLNKLETQALRRVQYDRPDAAVHAQSLRFRLANGAWYKPDLWTLHGGRLLCWEAKCIRGKGAKKGLLAVKVAAAQYPEVDFWLVTKERSGPLRFERVLP